MAQVSAARDLRNAVRCALRAGGGKAMLKSRNDYALSPLVADGAHESTCHNRLQRNANARGAERCCACLRFAVRSLARANPVVQHSCGHGGLSEPPCADVRSEQGRWRQCKPVLSGYVVVHSKSGHGLIGAARRSPYRGRNGGPALLFVEFKSWSSLARWRSSGPSKAAFISPALSR